MCFLVEIEMSVQDLAEKQEEERRLVCSMMEGNWRDGGRVFQENLRCQENEYQLTINNQINDHIMSYTYLNITITASGNVNMVNALSKKL